MNNVFGNLELDRLNEKVERTVNAPADGDKPERKHERYHLGIIQGDRYAGDFEQTVSAARYGLSPVHAAILAGRDKDTFKDDTETAIGNIFPGEPTKKNLMALHRYVRVGSILQAADAVGHTEESLLELILNNPGPRYEE